MNAERRKEKWRRIGALTIAAVLGLGAVSGLIFGVAYRLNPDRFAEAEKLISAKGTFDGDGERTEKAVTAYRRFGAELFSATSVTGRNTAVSNLSAYLALAILSQGANGRTKDQLAELLGLDDGELFGFALYLYRRYSDNEAFRDTVRVVNGIWMRAQEEMLLSKRFLTINAQYFGSEIYAGAFDNRTVSAVNRRISGYTDGKIKKAIAEIAKETNLFLINTLLVQAEWQKPWKEYSSMEFTAGGKTVKTEGLSRTLSSYYDSGNALAFSYPLKNGLSFIGILPDKSAENYAFDGAEMEKLLSSRLVSHKEETEEGTIFYRYEVSCSLPKFSCDCEADLKKTLSSMGADEMFTDFADFGGISPNAPLKVNEIYQKTAIDVNKDGVSMAAATIVEAGDTSAQPIKEVVEKVVIRLDRPFLYLLYDEAAGLPLFIGSVYSI